MGAAVGVCGSVFPAMGPGVSLRLPVAYSDDPGWPGIGEMGRF